MKKMEIQQKKKFGDEIASNLCGKMAAEHGWNRLKLSLFTFMEKRQRWSDDK